MTTETLDFVRGHAPGMGGIGYALHDEKLAILSCGQDGQICIRQADDLSKITFTAQAEGAAGHCLAVSSVTQQFAVGDQGHFVKVGPSSASNLQPSVSCCC